MNLEAEIAKFGIRGTPELSREQRCAANGYFPPWRAAELYGTDGLHPADMLPALRTAGLKMAWASLRDELVFTCGMTPGHADSLIAEARMFERDLA